MTNLFLEQQLDLGVNFKAAYSIKFDTLIVVGGDGAEYRRVNWSQPLITAQLGGKVVNNAELAALIAFHASVKGSYYGFRLKDWSDYIATNQALIQLTSTTYQLVKTYTIGSHTVIRAITKPVSGSIKLYQNGTQVTSGWVVDTTTGIITTSLTGTLTASFEFDVPARFEQDQLSFQFQAYNKKTQQKLFALQPLAVTEIRQLVNLPITAIPQGITDTLGLNYDFRTVGGPVYKTQIVTSENSFEDRLSKWAAAAGKWNVGDRSLLRSELDYFIAFFRVCRGAAVAFKFKDWQDEITKTCRFESDSIGFTFEAFRRSDKEVIFTLSGLPVKELIQPTNSICQPTIAFFDGGFSNGFTYALNNTAGNTGIVAVASSGGNPSSCLDFYINVPHSTDVYAIFIDNNFGYTYAGGTLASISYSFDCKGYQNDSQHIYPQIAIKQGSNFFLGGSASLPVGSTWQTTGLTTVLAGNFTYIGNTAGGFVTGTTLNLNASFLIGVGGGLPSGSSYTFPFSSHVYIDNVTISLNINCP